MNRTHHINQEARFYLKKRLIQLMAVCLLMGMIIGNSSSFAQDRKAQKRFERGNTTGAIKRYLRLLDKNPGDIEYMVSIAELYHQWGRSEAALKWQGRAITSHPEDPSLQFVYAKYLMEAGKFAQAEKWFIESGKTAGDARMFQKQIAASISAQKLRNDSLGYEVKPVVGINSEYGEMGAVPYYNGIVFSSNRRRGFFFWLANPDRSLFYDLYFAKRKLDFTYEEPRKMDGRINTRFNDGPVAFSVGETEAYVTRNHRGKGPNRNSDKENELRIELSRRKGDNWSKPERLTFNNVAYSVAHPALSADGNTLYFTAQLPGSYGGFDIWKSQREENGWGTPENLGATINTPADEAFPEITTDGTLYFASNRLGGQGGWDIYMAPKNEGNWAPPHALGYPLNTHFDEFGIHFERNREEGFFTSNRDGGQGNDDIYRFKRFPLIRGTVVDAQTGMPVPGASVEIMNILEQYAQYESDTAGMFYHSMVKGREAMVKINAPGYKEKKQVVQAKGNQNGSDYLVQIELEPSVTLSLKIAATDAATQAPIANAKVRLRGLREEILTTDVAGIVESDLSPNRNYVAIIAHPGYRPEVVTFETRAGTVSQTHEFFVEMEVGDFVFVRGDVRDKESGAPLSAPSLKVVTMDSGKVIQTVRGEYNGRFWASVPAMQNFSIVASKTGYFSDRLDVYWDSLQSDTVIGKIGLVSVEAGKAVKTIYHPYNESRFKRVGRRDLDEIAFFLKDNPELEVELVSHTDSRGNARYNQRLSLRRASEVREYLYRQGIPPQRIQVRGLGEAEPVNKCRDGIPCTDEEHSLNRRTEVRVLQYKSQDKEISTQ